MSGVDASQKATGIRAFVGHSFVDDDAQVVRKFLDYFTQLSKSHPRFTWEHAQQAEPRVLADKVLGLIDDKNVFIGICTRKERVVLDQKLVRGVLSRDRRWARERDIGWKTSDWVIQEIGLAVGKKLDVILLLERGVRAPGGLQGDLEYIEFDRDHPEASFGKLLEMISALSPRLPVAAATSLVKPASVADEQAEVAAAAGDMFVLTPAPSWHRRDYQFAYFHYVFSDDADGLDRIDQAYLATEHASEADHKATWEAFCENARLRFGRGGKLSNLQALAQKYPRSSGVLEQLALAHDYYQNFDDAARVYKDAASFATGIESRLWLTGRVAVEEAKSGERSNALASIAQMKALKNTDPSVETAVLEALRQVAELTKDDQATLGALERLAELKPGDSSTMFSLAFKHSECGNTDLALLHYLRIPEQERDSATWNNLGVAFQERALPAKSVAAYRRSKSMGETLAMANLAYNFISGGFLAEAQSACDEALRSTDYHKNVSHALARLKEVPGEEETKLAELLQKARPVGEFYKSFGRAIGAREPSEVPSILVGPDCPLTVQLDGSLFFATGSYERSGGVLTNALLGFGGSISSGRYRVEYRGTLRGRTVDGIAKRTQEDEPATTPSLLGPFNDEKRVLMILSEDGREVQVMEIQQGSVPPRFYVLKRHAGAQ